MHRTATSRNRRLTIALLLPAILAVTLAAPAFAQLNGGSTYPINGTQNPPVSFGTIADAVTYLTASGVAGSGQVVLEIGPGYPGDAGPITIAPIPGASATLGVTFRPTTGYTALTSIAGATATPWAIRISGSYITLEGQRGGSGGGRDWTVRCTGSGTTGFGQSAVRVDNTSNAVTDVSVRNCVLEGEAANTTSAIFGLAGGSTYTMKNLTVENNLIRSTGNATPNIRGYGITIANATNTGNTGLIVRNNVINQFYARGINFTGGFPGAQVYGNEIAHTAQVTQPSTTEFSGLYFSSTASQGAVLHGNFVHDIQLANGTTAVNGLYLFNGNTSGTPIGIYDNRVALGPGIVPTTVAIYGLRDNTVSNALFNVDYNSVYIGGSPAAGTANSAAFRKEVASALNIRDNILFNARSNSGTATGTNWAISIINTTNLVSLGYNDYHANGTGGVLGTTNNTVSGNQATLAAWRTAVPLDVASVSQDPNYVNPAATPPDLHVSTASPTQLESGGTAVAGLDYDFEGEIRQGSPGYAGSGTAPDIGADEFAGTPQDLTPPSIVYTPLASALVSGTRTLAGVTVTDASGVAGAPGTRPRVYYKRTFDANTWLDNTSATNGWKFVEASGSASPFDFTIDHGLLYGGSGVAAGDTVQYFVVAQDLASPPNVGVQAGIFAAAPASVALTAAAFPMAGALNSYRILPCLLGTKTVGPGGDYATLKDAFDAVNNAVLCGALTLEIVPAGTTETASAVLNAVAYDPGGPYTITIRPQAGATPTIMGSVGGALVRLNGADNVIIDGSNSGGTTRDLTIVNTSAATASAAIWMSSLGAGQGAASNTVRNTNLACGVDQSTSSSESFAILTSGAAISTTSDGADNDHNTFSNNAITRARWGIYLRGAAGNPNDLCGVRENLVGPAAFGADQIGRGGIVLEHQNGASVARNEVRFVGCLVSQTASGADRVGIGLGANGWTPSTTVATGCTISRNLIHDIVDEKTFSGVGIVVAGSGPATGNTVANNMIHDVRANGTAGDQALGIGVYAGDGDRVVYNSVSLSGDLDPSTSTSATQSAAGLRIAAVGVTNLTLLDNVLAVDVSSNTATLKHYAVVAPAVNYPWGAGGANHNDYHVNTGTAQMVLGGLGTTVPYTEVGSLSAWRASFTPNQDANSVSALPPFVSATDLHLNPSLPTVLESGGAPVAGVTVDYDGETRNAATPDIGADEGNFTPLIGNDMAATALVDPPAGGWKSAGVPFAPQASFTNAGLAQQLAVPVRYRILDALSTVVYNQTATIDTVNPGDTRVVTFPGATLAAAGNYTMEAIAELPGDAVPVNDRVSGALTVYAPLSGNYDVGTGGAFGTLTAAVTALNLAGVSGPVTFTLIDASYSAGETFPLVIDAFAGAGPGGTLTIKPKSGVQPVISGAPTGCVLKLNGADWVVIDGSNTAGGTTRDLTITNTSALGATAALCLVSLGEGLGAAHNVVRNVNLSCGADPTSSSNETFGLFAGGATVGTSSDGADNDANSFVNNEVTKARWGLYLRGAAANPNDSLVVTDNTVGPAAFGATEIGKAGIVLQHQNAARVTRNEVRCVGVVSPQTAGGSSRAGIVLGGIGGTPWAPASTTVVSNSVVERNLIHDIADEKTYSALGILVGGSGAPSANVIANNMIHSVHANGTSGDQTVGIGISAGDGDQVVYNSVSLSGDLDPGTITAANHSAAGVRIQSATVANLVLEDNALSVDVSSNTGTLMHYTVIAPSNAYAWGTGASNHNDYWFNPGNPQMALGGLGTAMTYTTVTDLPSWKGTFTPAQDAASLNVDPLFISPTDLHLNPITTPLESAGIPIAAVPFDYDGEPRNAATPDIGADEVGAAPAVFTLTVSTAAGHGTVTRNPDQPSYPAGTGVVVTAVPAAGWAFLGWSGDTTGTANPFTIVMYANKTFAASFGDTARPAVTWVAPNGGAPQLVIGTPATLQWTATDNWGVTTVDLYLSRTGAGGAYDTLATGAANSGSYAWTVTGPPSATAFFKVVAHDSAGNVAFDVSDSASAIIQAGGVDEGPVTVFALSAVQPNPVRGAGRMVFSVPREARVKLAIFDVQGREVEVLAEGSYAPGRYTAVWSGGRAHAGIYFARFETPGRSFVKRLVLTR